MKRGRKPKAINVVKLTEKERKKFGKKFNCKRCHNYFVDTREELEHHMEYLHGEYSEKKHREAKDIDPIIHEIYLNRNKKREVKEETLKEKLNVVECFLVWCKNCGKANAIHMDLEMPLQDDIVCDNCRMNIFTDNQTLVVNDMSKRGFTPIQYENKFGIKIRLFKDYTEKDLKMKTQIDSFDRFMKHRRNRHAKKN